MSFLRPEAVAFLTRWREAIAAGGVALFGLWVASGGGPVLLAIGAVLVLAAAWLARNAVSRARFARAPEGPGVVEVDEGQVGWYGPGIGGFVSLAELRDLSLVTVAGMRCWRLTQADGRLLLIPVDATGADRLFDAFAALPGLDPADLTRALEAGGDGPRILWRARVPRALAAPQRGVP